MRKVVKYHLETATNTDIELNDGGLSLSIEHEDYDIPRIDFANPAMLRAFINEMTDILRDWDSAVS